jgi:hypothetical protein
MYSAQYLCGYLQKYLKIFDLFCQVQSNAYIVYSFQIITAVIIKFMIFWDMTSCSFYETTQHHILVDHNFGK